MAFSSPKIRDGKILLKDGNVIDCCCGGESESVVCSFPIKECHSINGSAESAGWIKDGDTIWRRYKTRTFTEEITGSPPSGDPDVTETASGFVSESQTYSNFSAGTIAFGCVSEWTSVLGEYVCSASGSYSRSVSYTHTWGLGNETNGVGLIETAEISSAEGISIEGSDPPEFYGPCCYKITTTVQILRDYFGTNFDGSAPEGIETDNDAVQAWFDGGSGGDAPCMGTATSFIIECNVFNILGYLVTGSAITEGETYSEPATYSGVVSEMNSKMDADLNFSNLPCLSNNCSSYYEVTPLPSSIYTSVYLSKRKSRYRFSAPVGYLGDYYKVVWDIIETPETGPSTVISANQQWTKTGSGQGSPSSWYELAAPTANKSSRTVSNIRYQCVDGGTVYSMP